MLSLRGYFNGKEFVPIDKVDIKPNQKVIITILDEYFKIEAKPDKSYKKYVGKLSLESFNEISDALKETDKVDIDEW